MRSQAEKILDHYLMNNDVVVTLESGDLLLLKKLLYDFAYNTEDFMATSVLLAYCTKTLSSKESFHKDLAKVSNKALEIILDLKAQNI